MKAVHITAYVMAFVFIVGETSRRSLDYFPVNATTMVEDYLCGALLLWAAISWSRKYLGAPKLMAVAWAYGTGGMFVPFAELSIVAGPTNKSSQRTRPRTSRTVWPLNFSR